MVFSLEMFSVDAVPAYVGSAGTSTFTLSKSFIEGRRPRASSNRRHFGDRAVNTAAVFIEQA